MSDTNGTTGAADATGEGAGGPVVGLADLGVVDAGGGDLVDQAVDRAVDRAVDEGRRPVSGEATWRRLGRLEDLLRVLSMSEPGVRAAHPAAVLPLAWALYGLTEGGAHPLPERVVSTPLAELVDELRESEPVAVFDELTGLLEDLMTEAEDLGEVLRYERVLAEVCQAARDSGLQRPDAGLQQFGAVL